MDNQQRNLNRLSEICRINIRGFERYKVNREGDVFGVSGRKMKPVTTKQGYLRIQLSDGINKRSFLVHRLVALTFLDNSFNLPEVNHKDGNKGNNHVDNLEWVTREENMTHSFLTGLNSNRLGNNSRAILTEEDVVDIYTSSLNGESIVSLATEYKVSESCISDITKKRNWKEITENLPDIPPKNKTALNDNVIHWVCSKLENGYSPSEIYKLNNCESLTIHQIRDIKRRRYCRKISDEYCW